MKKYIIKFLPLFSLFFLLTNVQCEESQSSKSDKAGNDQKFYKTKASYNIRYGATQRNVVKNSNSDRLLDVYIPQGMEEKLPVVVFIHGGGFKGGDKEGTESLCSKIASLGFAVVSINYYLTLTVEKISNVSAAGNMANGIPKGGFQPALNKAIKDASNDTQLALEWIKSNQEEYNFDISSIAVSGGSAGAMTALYTAYVSNQKILPIGAVVNLWGGLEKSGLVQKGAPPLLTYHGDQDKTISVDFAFALDKRMKEINNDKSVLHILEGKGHAQYKNIEKNRTKQISKFLKDSFAKK